MKSNEIEKITERMSMDDDDDDDNRVETSGASMMLRNISLMCIVTLSLLKLSL